MADMPNCAAKRAVKAPRRITVTPSASDSPLLIKALLRTALQGAPEQEIVYRDRVRYDYTEFDRRVRRLANGLSTLGIGPGDTVGVMDWDSHRYLECYFGIPSMGAVLHTVNVRLSPEQILYTINHAEDDALLVHPDFLPLVEEIWPRIERPCTIVLLAEDVVPESGLPVAALYETMLAEASVDFVFPDFDENSCATTFYTTGTTGLQPKGVYFSHRQIVLHTLAASAALSANSGNQRLHRGDVYMPVTPMFHVHAWGVPFVATMLGLKQVYPGRYAPDTLLNLLATEKVTFSHCVPTLLQMLVGHPASAAVDLRGLKMVIGGSALSTGLAQAALARGIDVFTGYGMSETCPIVTLAQLPPALMASSPEQQLEIRTRAGWPLPLVDLRIVDPAMDDVSRDGGTTGEVVLRAPWLTQGYLKDAAGSETLWQGGYLHTGDVGRLDRWGQLEITDRIKDVIKTGGEWVSSIQIEDLISKHPAVGETAVIGVPDGKWGERPVALVVPSRGCSVDEGSIQAHLQTFSDQGLISKWAIPARVIVTETLDKTSVGKLDKKRIRDRLARNDFS